MAKMSMIFMPSLRKSHFLGAPANLRMYSMVNHMMQTTSSMASLGLSVGSPLSSTPFFKEKKNVMEEKNKEIIGRLERTRDK